MTPATVADHVQPHRGNCERFWCGELQSLCEACHAGAKQELERTGHLRGSNAEGEPLDPNHHWHDP
jgi:5-methylcytosine-specific restriction protein A